MVLTTDRSYLDALRPRIKFKSIDESDTYFTFNAFNENQDLNVRYLDTSNSIGETGDFNILIEDSNGLINKDHLRNTKVFIELGKTEESLDHFMIGYADIFDISRPMTDFMEYRVSGFGSQIQAHDLLLLIRQSAKDDNDPEFSVKRLFERAIEERKFRLLNRGSLEDVLGWDTNISDDLKTIIPVIQEEFTTLADFYDRIAATEGCNWWIDYKGGNETLTAKHPSFNGNGVIIKSSDLRHARDRADKVAYIEGEFGITEDASGGAGVRTALYTTTRTDKELVSSNEDDKGRTTLNQRFIAQQVDLLNDQRRITDLAFRIERIGEPASPKGRVNGFIIKDDDDTPTGTIIGKFNVDLGSLERATHWIEINDLDPKTRFLEGGSKIWLAFTDRSGIKGNVEDDPDNTVAVHHDNTTSTHTAGSYSAVAAADENFREDPTLADWKVSTSGPVYNYKVMSSIRRLQGRSNYTAEKILRRKEAFIDSSWLKDPKSVNKFLALNLNPISKPRRTINNLMCTIPNDFLFRAYETTNFADALSGIDQEFQIIRVGYTMSALPGDPQRGTYNANLTLNSSYNSLLGSCSCL